MSQGYTEKPAKVKVNNIEINYLKLGNGPETLFFLSGALGLIDDFYPLFTVFDRKKYTVVVWEAPGYGLSRPPDRDFSPGYLDRDAEHAILFMEALNIDRYSLFGWCNGGTTALIIASKAVDRVDRLVVWGCNAYVTEKDIEFYEKTRDIYNWSSVRRSLSVAAYGEKYTSETWGAWIDAHRETLERNGGDICLAAVQKIVAPTLIVHGTNDEMVLVEHAFYLHENIKGSKLVVFPEGRHIIHLVSQEEFVSNVNDFLTSTSISPQKQL